MSLLFADNALTTLSLSINGSVTSIVVSDVSKFPSITNVGTDNFHIVVVSLTDYEEMVVTAVDSVAKTFTVVRSSSPKIFPAGSYVGLYNTSAVMSLIQSMAGASSTLTRAVVSVDLSGTANQLVGDEIINFTFSSDFAIKNSGKNWTRPTSAITFRGFYYLNQTTVLASTDSGIYRSTDSGVTWSVLYAACKSVCPIIDVPNASVTGGKRLLSFDSPISPKLYYSDDSGNTWATITFNGFSTYVYYIINLNDSTTNPTLLAATNSGIYKSTDSGVTWVQKNSSAIPSNITKVGNAVFSASDVGIYKSTDSGERWDLVSSDTSAFASITQIDTSGQKLLALKSVNAGGIISTNGGSSWTSISDLLITANNFRSCLFTGTSILAGSAAGTVYISLDGLSWATTDLTGSTSVNAFLLASDYVLAGTSVGTYKSTDKSSFSITLPDQLPQYASTTISFSPPAGYVALNSAQLLQSLIVTSRPTYNASIVTNAAGNTVLQIDTNSASNIIGGTILVSTNSFAGSLSLSTTDGGVTTSASTISIVDNRPGVSGTYTYSAPSGATNAQICGDIAFGETLKGYWFSVSSSNTTRTRLILESITIGLLSDTYKPQVTFTNPNTLSASVNIVATGTGSSGTGNDRYVLPIANTTAIGGVKANPRPAGQFVTGINTADGSLTFDTPTAGSVNSVTGNIVSGTALNPVVTQLRSDWTATNGVTFIENQPTISIGQNNFSKFSQITFLPNSFTVSSGPSFNTPQPVSVSLNPATISNLGGVIATSGGTNQFVSGVFSDGRLAYGSPINPPTPTRAVVAFDVTGQAAQTTGDEVLNFAFSNNFAPLPNGNTWFQSSVTNNSFTGLYSGSSFALAGSNSSVGIYRSTDNGQTWTQTAQTTGKWYSFALSPNGSQIIACGDGGILKSTDNGLTWSAVSGTAAGASFFAVAASSTTMVATSNNGNGIYRSTDNGNTWSVTGATSSNFTSVAVNSTGLFVAGNTSTGVWVSSNQGQTWTRSTGRGSGWVYGLGVGANNRFILLDYNSGMYYSDSPSGAWTASSSSVSSPLGFYKVNDNLLLVGTAGSGIYKSTDNGVTWSQTSANSGTYGGINMSGANLVAASDYQGIWLSTTATSLSLTLPAHNSYPVQNVSVSNLVATDNATSSATKLQTAILAVRPTYTTSITGNATLVVDTNSTGNITDTTLIQTGSATGTLALSITQGGAAGVLPSIVITDVRDGSTYQYSPSYGATNNQICNEISLGETLPNYWFYVSGSNSTKTRLTLESISTGSISTQLPTMTITNPNTLSSTRTIISPGS